MTPENVGRVAWLLTRGEESVRLQVEEGPPGLHLRVYGPGAHSAVHGFPDRAALDEFHADLERTLIAQGFTVQAFEERREGRGRGESSPAGDRRR